MYFFRSAILLVIGWMSFHPIFGQNLTPTSARSVGLAETNTVISDPWGIINNPAGLSESNQRSHLLLSYHNRYSAYGIHDAVLGFSLPIGRLTSAAAVSFFGDELLSETKASVILADHIGISQLGLRINYHQLAVMNYGSAHAFSIDLGGAFNITDEFILGMLISNIGQAKYNTESLSRVPTAISIGVAYQPYHELSLQAQIDKDLNSPMDVRFGLEYQPHLLIMLRTGVSTLQPTAYLGFGLITNHLIFDLAGQYNADLGFSAVFSFDIALGKE
jgi:hypothetical protein